jgi:acid phosphatase (class A)
MRTSVKVLSALAALVLGSSAVAQQAPAPARPGGYLPPEQLIDAMTLIPPPPTAGSPAEAADAAAYRTSRALAGTPRWEQAIADVELRAPATFKGWSCAAGVKISAETTPVTAEILMRILADAGLPPNAPKEHYKRPRPLIGDELPACVPRGSLATNYSYPSGHASVGWARALVLAELKPERADLILLRGREFGDSRVVCGVHYPSDVEAGRLIGAGAVARLHANAEFQAAMAKARAELARASAKPDGC